MDSPDVTLHLLDGSQSQPTQTWKLKGLNIIRIGRSEENEIIIRQQSVSRLHVTLKWEQDRWLLHNDSRFGTMISGFPVNDYQLKEGDRFQLGPMGPYLSIHAAVVAADNNREGTISVNLFNSADVNAKKAEQVEEIVKSDYFKQLQQEAKKLKAASATHQ